MPLIVIALALIGFAFPPAWLALVGYGIYAVASRKSRRDEAVESRVKKLVLAGQHTATFSDLYFEAARSYAVDKGAKAADAQAASAHILLDGRNYFVVFTKAHSGGTVVSVEDADAVKRRIFDEPMDDIRKQFAAKPDETLKVGGFTFPATAADEDQWAEMISQIAHRIIALSPTELDIYRYLMEEADRMAEGDDASRIAVENTGFHSLEYAGEMAKAHQFPDNRAALDYLNTSVTPDLSTVLDAARSEKIRGMIFTFIVQSNLSGVNGIRKKYAVHYANTCAQNGHFRFVDKWDAVINSIP